MRFCCADNFAHADLFCTQHGACGRKVYIVDAGNHQCKQRNDNKYPYCANALVGKIGIVKVHFCQRQQQIFGIGIVGFMVKVHLPDSCSETF